MQILTAPLNKIFAIINLLLVISLAGGSFSLSMAQEPEPQYRLKTFTQENSGLPDNRITAVARTSDRSIWVGTEGGLARFHEGQWEDHTTDALGPVKGPLEKNIEALAVTRDGTLWVGSFRGLARWQTETGAWEKVVPPNLPNLYSFHINALTVDNHGALWAAGSNFLGRFTPRNGWKFFGTGDGLYHEGAEFMAPGRDGSIWLWTTNFRHSHPHTLTQVEFTDNQLKILSIITEKGKEIQPFFSAVYDLLETPDGTLWIGTDNGLVRRRQGQWKIFRGDKDGLPGVHIAALSPADGRDLWVAIRDGGFGLFRDERVLRMFDLKIGIKKFLQDLSGATWIGTGGQGLLCLQKSLFQMEEFEKIGLHSYYTYATAFLVATDGTLWAATNRGLACYKDHKWKVIQEIDVSKTGNLLSLAETKEGIWVGSLSGLFLLKKGEPEFKPVGKETPGFHDKFASNLAVDPNGALWGASKGPVLSKFQEGKWQTFRYEEKDVPINYVTALTAAPDGSLWMAVKGVGLFKFYKEKWHFFQNPEVDALLVIKPSSLEGVVVWAATARSLIKFQEQDNKWERIDLEQAGLKDSHIQCIAKTDDGALWMGTSDGLARFDGKHWQVFTDKNLGWPVGEKISINRITKTNDGNLWVAIDNKGLMYLRPPTKMRIIKFVGPLEGTKLYQEEQTFGVWAFDPDYLNESNEYRFRWYHSSDKGEEITLLTRDPFRRFKLAEGKNTFEVVAIDRFGYQSEPLKRIFTVALPKSAWWEAYRKEIMGFVGVIFIYVIILPVLIQLHPRYEWARSWVNSGAFHKFPRLHRAMLNSRWGRRRLFRYYLQNQLKELEIPPHYIAQELFEAGEAASLPLTLENPDCFFKELFLRKPRGQILGRSGTGKSVLMRKIFHLAAVRFLEGGEPYTGIPIWLNLPIHHDESRDIENDINIRWLNAGDLEFDDKLTAYVLRKGGFLVLVDSLNEMDPKKWEDKLKGFLGRQSRNCILMASQQDFFKDQEPIVVSYRLGEISPEQAVRYFSEQGLEDRWLHQDLQVKHLARHPADLVMIALFLHNNPKEDIPPQRVKIYKDTLKQDTALRAWWDSDSPQLRVICELAFRMLEKEERLLPPETLARRINQILADRGLTDKVQSEAVIEAVKRCHVFVEVKVPGEQESRYGFSHELLGKYMASRHLVEVLEEPEKFPMADPVSLSGEHKWTDTFEFVLQELESGKLLNQFLLRMLAEGGKLHLYLASYAVSDKEKKKEPVGEEVFNALVQANLYDRLR